MLTARGQELQRHQPQKLLHVQNSYLVQEVLILEFLALLQWQEAEQINTLAHLTAGLGIEKGANPPYLCNRKLLT